MYLIDTNILINSSKVTNPIDIHPTFWIEMEKILSRPDVISIDKVKDEIYYFEDTLTLWCKEKINNSFWKSSSGCITEYGEIQNWAQTKNYNQRAVLDFADSKNADPFLVAYALNKKREDNETIKIVTLEVSSPDSKKIIKLPDVCNEFDITYMNNNDFYRAIGVSF